SSSAFRAVLEWETLWEPWFAATHSYLHSSSRESHLWLADNNARFPGATATLRTDSSHREQQLSLSLAGVSR
ncbi:hypothetical protein HKK80_06910, partial [Halonotius sp. F2-221B]|uniref:hypothetical protein n=1 Tax=Halonotius sp. F2-221B TaxID=2731620 RepID=UPI00398AA77A